MLTYKAYRVEIVNENPLQVGGRYLCFTNQTDAYAYVIGWYGDDCDLFEIVGDYVPSADLPDRHEDVQLSCTGPRILVQVRFMEVKHVTKIGTFRWKKDDEGTTVAFREES